MLQLSGAGKRYGHKLLFEKADWLITPESRIGLVGANGTGKSTVMKVLAGLESLDYGSISRAKGISAGYLPQDGLTLSGRSIFDECLSIFAGLHAMEEEMEALTHSMSELDPSSAEPTRMSPTGISSWNMNFAPMMVTPSKRKSERSSPASVSLSAIGATHRRILRRLADAHRARQAAARKAEPAAARRAHQPSRPRSPQLAGGIPGELSRTPIVLISHDRYFLDVTVRQDRRNLEQATCTSTPATTSST